MKVLIIIFLTFLFLGCGSGGGSDGSTVSEVQSISIPDSAQTVPLLIIQVEFSDQVFSGATSTWAQKFFGTNQGNLNHYFLETSYNKFALSPASEDYSSNDGFIKVRLNSPHPNPADGTSNFDTTIAIPALTEADPFIDFAQYDTNNNNQIEKDELQIMFLVAGGEQATGLGPNDGNSGIWAHQSYINGVSFDGVSVMQYPSGSYTAFGERHYYFDIRGNDATIGIIAHELGHGVFGLPDLYDTDRTSQGIGGFGLMGSGSWGYTAGNDVGSSPSHMSAYTKIRVNFTTANIVNVSTNNYELLSTDTASYQPLRINTSDNDEYFLIENRSQTGYDAGLFMLDNALFTGGVAVWHIDESQSDNRTDARRLVDLEEADTKTLDSPVLNNNNNVGDRSNLFVSGNNTFTPSSTPSNSNLNNASPTTINITNITETGSTASLDISL